MYLDNPKKLFDDLKAIPTMYNYMESCEEDGQENDLENLIGIVDCYHDQLNDGDMNGSCRWDLSTCETEQERQQMLTDYRTINWIWKQIKKELKAKYVVVCMKCGYAWFYQKRSKCITSACESDTNTYSKYKCYCGGKLNVYTFEEWLIGENKYNDVRRYL